MKNDKKQVKYRVRVWTNNFSLYETYRRSMKSAKYARDKLKRGAKEFDGGVARTQIVKVYE